MLTLLERQPDLLRSQVGDRESDRADLLDDRVVTIRRELNPDCPFHGVALQCDTMTILRHRLHIRSAPRITRHPHSFT
jgi:hypothetical protein